MRRRADLAVLRLLAPGGEHALRELVGRRSDLHHRRWHQRRSCPFHHHGINASVAAARYAAYTVAVLRPDAQIRQP